MEEEKFIAFMRPTTSIKEMCRIYATELPITFEYEKILFTTRQIKEIESLLIDHLTSFVDNKGGYEKLNLMTEEEIEEEFQRDHQQTLDLMASYFNTTRDEVSRALKRPD